VTINDNTNNYVVTATGTTNTLQGEANLLFDGSTLTANRNITVGTTQTSNTDIRINNATNGSIHYIFSDASTGQLGVEAGSTRGLKFNTNGANTRMTITSAGDVGIGTTSPSGKLHLQIGAENGLYIYQTSGGGGGQLILDTNFGGGNQYSISPYVSGVSNGGFSIRDNTNGVNRIVIQSATGNVGIGTSSPSYTLQVQKTSIAAPAFMVGGAYYGGPRIQTYGLDADGSAWMGLGTDMGGGPYEHTVYFPDTGTWGFLGFGTYNGTTYSEKMRITRTGNVGIGTTSPAHKLQVGSFSTAANIGIYSTSYGNDGLLRFYGAAGSEQMQIGAFSSSVVGIYVFAGSGLDLYSNGSVAIKVLTSGNVGIGTTSPGEKLAVSGNITVTGNLAVSTGNTTGGGIILADDGITAYGSPSDARKKNNIEPLQGALNIVKQLRGVTFNWNDNTDEAQYTKLKEDIGFIAQEVREIVPTIVREDTEGYLSIRDRALIPILVEAIKELNAKIDKLEGKY